MKRFLALFIFIGFFAIDILSAAPLTPQIPIVDLSVNAPEKPAQLVKSLNILLILTLLVLAPSLVMVMTSFTRLIIVFSFLRTAIGTQQMPPTQVLVSLAMVLTFFIMEPVGKKSYDEGIKPYMEERIGYDEAFTRSVTPFKNFMIKNTREKDLALFLRIKHLPNPKTVEDIPLTVIIPAFMISEMKTAFEIGFFAVLTVFGRRYGRLLGTDEYGYDDAPSCHGELASKNPTVCYGGRMDATDRKSRGEF